MDTQVLNCKASLSFFMFEAELRFGFAEWRLPESLMLEMQTGRGRARPRGAGGSIGKKRQETLPAGVGKERPEPMAG